MILFVHICSRSVAMTRVKIIYRGEEHSQEELAEKIDTYNSLRHKFDATDESFEADKLSSSKDFSYSDETSDFQTLLEDLLEFMKITIENW